MRWRKLFPLLFAWSSIAGYRMAVVAGVLFFVFRDRFALISGIALRHPIKKWGAVVALAAATLYLV
jgi:competence protein ComEC